MTQRPALVLALGTALAVSGCAGVLGPDAGAVRTLEARPSFDEAEVGYLALLDAVRAAVDDTASGLEWRAPEPRRLAVGGCPDPLDTVPGARRANYGQGGAAGVVADEDWPATVDAVRAVLEPHGFAAPVTIREGRGVHEVAFEDDLGARVVLGTRTSTILTLYGACFVADDDGS